MKLLISALLGAVFAKDRLKYVNPDAPCRKVSDKPQLGNVREPLKPVETLPEQFEWNNFNGVNYLTNLRN